jgi:long-chain acyl-CoA synthetase
MSGNVCVPLDPTIEQQNFEYIIKKTESDVCFAESGVLEKINSNTIKTITEKHLLQLTTN